MPVKLNITNQRFGKLTAIKPVSYTKNRSVRWLCICDCGKKHVAVATELKRGGVTRCASCAGKLRRFSGPNHYNHQHGHSGGGRTNRKASPEYMAWHSMRSRCTNPNVPSYRDYGGRGIKVDPRWDNFQIFLNDVGPRPHPDLILDRIDNHKGYFPGNVRWTDKSTSNKNRRSIRTELSQFTNTELFTELKQRLRDR